MKAKGTSLQRIFEVITSTIDTKTGNKVVFRPTTKLPLPPKPIANISEQFPSSLADQRDFFYLHEINASSAEVHLAFTIPGTTQQDLHASMKNTFKQYFLWLTSEELSAKQQVWIGWIKYGNIIYTDSQGQATKIQEEMTTMAEVNPEAAKQFDKIKFKIKGRQFIHCRPGKIFRNNDVTGEGILIYTTNNNYGCILQLLGMLRPNSISPYYQIITKSIKRDMDKVFYDGLIHLHQDEVNKQPYIEITNAHTDLFDTFVNFSTHPQSVSGTIKKNSTGTRERPSN